MMNRKLFYLFLLLLVTFFWGVTFPLIKESLAYISPLNFLFLRFLLSSVIMIPFLAGKREFLKRRTFTHGMIAGFLLFLGYYFQTVGLEYTTSSRSGIITGLYVVLIPLFSMLLLKKKPRPADSGASVISFLGLVMMSLGSLGNSSIQLGDMLTIVCAAAYAIQIVYVSRFSREIETWSFTFYQLFAVSIFSAVMIPFSGPYIMQFPPIVIFTLVFTAVFAGILAIYVSNRALIHVEPSAAGVIFVGEPVFAVLASVMILNEGLSVYTIAGGSIMVVSMLITAYDRIREERSLKSGDSSGRKQISP